MNLPAAPPASTTVAQPPGMRLSSDDGDRGRAGDVDEHLHDVGPDHRRHAAAHGVDDHRRAEHEHDPRHRHAGDDGDHQRRREQPDAVGERSREQKDHRRQRLDARAEAPLQQLVRREQIAAEVGGDEQQADDDAADDVAERELQKRHVAGVRGGGNADEGQRARLGGDDREADGPPGHAAVGQEVVARRLLEPREPGSEGGDGGEVAADDEVVSPGERHCVQQSTVAEPSASQKMRRGRARRATSALFGR